MANDSFVQVAPDSSGKQVDMESLTTGAGAPLYRQRAVLVGDSADVLFQILSVQQRQLAVLRALLAHFNMNDTLPRDEADFYNLD